jgi:hypothetical protein
LIKKLKPVSITRGTYVGQHLMQKRLKWTSISHLLIIFCLVMEVAHNFFRVKRMEKDKNPQVIAK